MEPTDGNDDLLWWLVPALICIAVAFAWSNHFRNGFHWDDFSRIVDNQAVQSLSHPTRFFTRPRTWSTLPEQTEYRPLLVTSFALDRAVAGMDPFVFQLDTFLWFALLILALYALFRVLPGGTHATAAVAAGLFAVHPAVADTVNYVSQRGVIVAALGIAVGLAFRIVWPARMPERLWVNTTRTTVHWQEEVLKARANRRNALYRRFIHLPLGLYLIPVGIAMLADPNAALFVIYLGLFDAPEFRWRRILPSAILCGGYFVFATLLTWRYGAATRISFPAWFLTQTFVAARDLFYFFLPANLNPDSALQPLTGADWPFAALGLAAVALVVVLAIRASRRPEWRIVAFGLWWFLIALLPTMLIPGSMAEANHRMFLPFIGLALAVTHTVSLLGPRLVAVRPFGNFGLAFIGLAFWGIVLSAAVWGTFHRNKIWESEDSLWQTAINMNPNSGRALLHGAQAALASASYGVARADLHRAEPLAAGDAALETDLALAFDQLGQDEAVERNFQLAAAANANYARARSAWAQWLLAHQQSDRALGLAEKAILLEPTDATAAHTLIDIYSQRFDWLRVKATARALLQTYPDDEAASRSLILAESTFDEIDRLASRAKALGSTNDYLKLSTLLFRNKRYRDSLDAARAALKIDGNLGEAWANISAAQHQLGQDDDAIASLKEVIRLRPDLAFARNDLAYLESHRGAVR